MSTKGKCYLCGKEVGPRWIGVASFFEFRVDATIPFHPDCFQEVAGTEFLDAIKEDEADFNPPIEDTHGIGCNCDDCSTPMKDISILAPPIDDEDWYEHIHD